MSEPSPQNSVFLITHEFYPKRGGIATFTEEMAKASADLGYDVEVWAQAAPENAEKSWPFRLRRLPVRGTHDFLCQVKLGLQLIAARRKLRYATVYLPEPGPMLAMMLLQHFHAFRPKRLVLTFHGSEILKFHRNPITRYFARRLIRHTTRISVLSNYTHQLLCTHFPEAADKILLTPGALRSDFVIAPSFSTTGKNKIIVLTVGRLHPRKGQLITLHALQALPPELRARIEYWVVGRGNRPHYEQSLRETAAQCDFPVRFFGDVSDEDLDRIYDRADIFAMTSIDHGHSIEGFGLVYLEAAAHSLPVVAHAIGGVSDAVIDGVTGFLVRPKHPAQLTAAFEQLVRDPELRRRLGSAGHTWAQRNNWAHSARLLFSAA